MKRYTHLIILSLCAALAATFTACQTEEIEVFTTDDALVYFQSISYTSSNGTEGYTTQTSYSFVGVDESRRDVTFRGEVRMMGKVVDYDRHIAIEIDNERTTMVEGVDYEANFDTICVKAGQNSARVPVKFLRNPSFREGRDTLVLHLKANEHFGVLEKYNPTNSYSGSSSDADKMDGTRYTFIIDELYTCPNGWYTLNASNYFGPWNVTKFIFINTTLGFVLSDWTWINGAGSKITAGRMPYYALHLQKELQARADAGDPVYDEDGSFMQLGENYRVDYSAYLQQ